MDKTNTENKQKPDANELNGHKPEGGTEDKTEKVNLNPIVAKGNYYPSVDFQIKSPYDFVTLGNDDDSSLASGLSSLGSQSSQFRHTNRYNSNSDDNYDYDIDITDDEKQAKNPQSSNVDLGFLQKKNQDDTSSKGEKALSDNKSKPKDGKEMTATGISTCEAKPLQKPKPVEEMTLKEYAVHLNPTLPEEGNVCVLCEKPAARLQCVLQCKRYFHLQCLELMALKKVINNQEMNCENCIILQHACAYCGGLSIVSPAKFRK